MRRFDGELAAENPVGALNDLASRPVAGRVDVVVKEAGRAAEDLLPVLVEGSAVLGDAAHGLGPETPRFACRLRPEAFEHLLGRGGGELVAT